MSLDVLKQIDAAGSFGVPQFTIPAADLPELFAAGLVVATAAGRIALSPLGRARLGQPHVAPGVLQAVALPMEFRS